MKRRLFFVAISMLYSLSTFSQLSVNSSGKVTITNNGYRSLEINTRNEGIYVTRSGNSSSSTLASITGVCDKDGIPTSIGVEGKSVSSSSTQYFDNLHRSYGVMGTAGHGSNGWNFGVLGRLQNSYGAGVYGSAITNDWGRNLSDPYAGYFNGNVQVLGNLQATGSVSGILLGASVAPTSVASVLAEDLEENFVSNKIANLSVVTYYKEQPVVLAENVGEEKDITPNWVSDIELQSLSKKHYALSAEQLEEVFPELVYTNADKSKSINYVEMIPLLLQSINELRSELNRMKKENLMYANSKKATEIEPVLNTVVNFSLSQNKPNPWVESTEIELSVPQNVMKAKLLVYDLTGKQVFEKVISERGNSSLKLTSADFTSGMYIYSLITDGKLIETKRMIVTK